MDTALRSRRAQKPFNVCRIPHPGRSVAAKALVADNQAEIARIADDLATNA
jgi:hypothetical protein